MFLPGTVLVSESTFRLVEVQFNWVPLGEITAKGFSQPITVYRPLAPRVDPGHAFGLAVPLVGRDAEFQILKGCVDDVYAGRGGIVMLTGDKGVGKSFLVTEMRHHFARQGALLAEAHDQELPPPAPLTWRSVVSWGGMTASISSRCGSRSQKGKPAKPTAY